MCRLVFFFLTVGTQKNYLYGFNETGLLEYQNIFVDL